MVYGPLAVPPATSAMDLAQRGSANSSPRSATRTSMSRRIFALAAALGIQGLGVNVHAPFTRT
eukprot:1142707-Prymnesium_polylepis.1